MAPSVAQGEPITPSAPRLERTVERLFEDDAAPGEIWIVKFSRGSDRAAEVRNARAEGIQVGRELAHVFSGMVIKGTKDQIDKLATRGAVERVEKSAPVRLAADQTGPDLPWGLDRVDQRNLPLDGRYRYIQTASNVLAYVIDSGINTSHSEFTGRIAGWSTFVDSTVEDCNGHGTHVAGTLGGTTSGVAKSVWLVPIRVFSCTGGGSSALWVSAMDWIMQVHPAGVPAVVNMSLGTFSGRSASVDDAVARLTSAGLTTVVAAGNDAADACTYSPSGAPSAITVANATKADAEAASSNYGSCVDLYGPGTDIRSAWIGTPTTYATISGTSMASPHVAGAAALLLATNPTMRPADITSRLIADSTKGVITNPFGGTPNRMLYIPTTSNTTVTATPPTFIDECGTDNDRYIIPATTGVDYMAMGLPAAAGTYPAPGNVWVSASAQTGYTLTGTTSWSRSFANGSAFTDVTPSAPFYSEICWLAATGVSTGYADGTFRPSLTVKRDAMAAFMYRLADSPAWTPPTTSPFADLTPQSPFYKEITWLANRGITTGYADGTFRPSLTVKRDAMAAFMYRLAGSPAWIPPTSSPFADVSPSRQFYREITWLANKGITTGYADGTFRPSLNVNRDAMAAFMYRLKVINKAV